MFVEQRSTIFFFKLSKYSTNSRSTTARLFQSKVIFSRRHRLLLKICPKIFYRDFFCFQDKQFGKVALFFPHSNPEADIVSGIKHYKQYTLERAYLGETFFWGLLPQPGDQLVFKFTTPITIKR